MILSDLSRFCSGSAIFFHYQQESFTIRQVQSIFIENKRTPHQKGDTGRKGFLLFGKPYWEDLPM